MKKNNANIILGGLLIVCAIFYILQHLGILPFWNMWDTVWGLFGAYLIYIGITERKYFSLFIGGAFLIGTLQNFMFPFFRNFSFWNLLVIAILLALGFELIFGNQIRTTRRNRYEEFSRDRQKSYEKETEETVVEESMNDDVIEAEFITVEIDEEDESKNQKTTSNKSNYYSKADYDKRDNVIFIETTFNSLTKYIRAESFEGGDVRTSFGTLRLDLVGSKLSVDDARLMVECNFGKITIYVSRKWAVVNNMSVTLGAINDNRVYANDSTRPQLQIFGNVTCGEVEIIYI